MREAIYGVYETEDGYWVRAFDGGGRPLKTDHSFKSHERAELECLSMNKIKALRDGTIDQPMSRNSTISWREFFDERITHLKELLKARKAEHV